METQLRKTSETQREKSVLFCLLPDLPSGVFHLFFDTVPLSAINFGIKWHYLS